MVPLVGEVRDLIGDPDNGSPQFNNQQVQNALDESRSDVRYELLVAAPTITNTANQAFFVWIDYYSRFQYWEIDAAVVQWGDYTQRSPVATEFINGHWQFNYIIAPGQLPPNADAPAQIPPLYVTGRTFDIYAAAVKLLKMLKAKYALTTFNFSANGQNFQAGTIFQTLGGLIADYSRKIIPTQIALVRDDIDLPYEIDLDQPVLYGALGDRLP